MKFVHFRSAAADLWGILQDDRIAEITAAPWEKWLKNGRTHALMSIQYLPPCDASKMFVVGWNYAAHARETGDKAPANPQFFPLAASSIIAHNEPVIYPHGVKRVDHEAELVVVIGKKGKDISEVNADQYIAGFSCGNDVSARDFQWNPDDLNIPRAKTVDTFSPIGPCLVTDLNYQNLTIEMKVNGEIRQAANTREMVFSIPQLISTISRYVTLLPGDVIFSGTPQGISPVQAGDVMEVSIEGIGTLRNLVVAE